MRKLILSFALLLTVYYVRCQPLQLQLQSTTSMYAPVKLSTGTKYYLYDMLSNYQYITMNSEMELKLYNLDGSLYKALPLPPKVHVNAAVAAIYYVSESLFDTDSTTLEYMIIWNTSVATGLPYHSLIQIVRENGDILLNEQDAYTVEMWTTGKYISVFKTEEGTKLQLYYISGTTGQNTGSKIFILPGSVPLGIDINKTVPAINPTFFPNPNNGAFAISPSTNTGLNLEFYTTDGKKIKTVDVGPDMKVNNLGLSSGVYLVKANDAQNNQSVVKKIIIE